MSGAFNLDRFVQAQDPLFERILGELEEGRKRSHWMWFVFPQLLGLGHSAMARHYALASLEEARAYLQHAILGPRLVDCTELVNRAADRSAHQIFGSPDDLKFHSCITLFALAQPSAPVFQTALATYFDGSPDRMTLDKLAADD